MSNRRKAKRPWLGKGRSKVEEFHQQIKGQSGLQEGDVIEGTTITAPLAERVVLKKVPAVIHWKDWDESEREDDEIVGETVIYTDGQFDMIVNGDVSDEAKSVLNFLQSKNPGNFSMAPKEE